MSFKDGDQAISVNGGNQITATVTTDYPTSDITKMWIGSQRKMVVTLMEQ